MDAFIAGANALCCAMVSLVAGWMVIDPRVRDGVLIKLGLICLSVGAGAAATLLGTEASPLLIGRAALLVNLGVATIAVGWYVRMREGRRRRRRVSDWTPVDVGAGSA